MRTIVFQMSKWQRQRVMGACRSFGCQTQDLVCALLDHADCGPLHFTTEDRDYFLVVPIDEMHQRILDGLCLKYQVDAHTMFAALMDQQFR